VSHLSLAFHNLAVAGQENDNGPAWLFDVGVSASVSLLHPQLRPNKLTPWMLVLLLHGMLLLQSWEDLEGERTKE
jgi:hypothetical protein